jgi:hypothetical protein
MPSCVALSAIISTLLAFAVVSPVQAAGEIVITQAKALAGGVTPGDAPGYPVTLSQPGAYVLESNLTVTPGTYGLFVTANNVDIDMNGFTLSGNGGGTYGLISGFGESSIHGGVINLFRNAGIYIRNNAWMIDNMQIVRNGGTGIDAVGFRFITLRSSLVAANGGLGLIVGNDGIIRGSTIASNKLSGIVCGTNCHIEGNAINANLDDGIKINSGMTIGNTIAENKFFGLSDYGDPADTGFANNMFIKNNMTGGNQVSGGSPVHPNFCTPLPCSPI